MPDTIKDGTGTGKLLKIDTNNRAHVSGVSIDEAQQANKLGDAYNINTKNITLTNDSDTPVLYIKNNETQGLHIRAIIIGQKPSTGSSTTLSEVTFIRNPITGTIISSTPTAVSVNSNRNYGSAKTLGVTAYVGATGDTMTDGEDHIFIYAGVNGRTAIGIDEVLPQGSSIGIKIKPPASNSSMVCYVAVICHLDDSAND